MPETKLEHSLAVITSSTSLRIVAGAIIFICLYYASSVVITLIFAILIAFVLDPGMVLLALGLVYLLIYVVYDRAATFIEDIPRLATRIKEVVEHIQSVITHLRQSTTSIMSPSQETGLPAVRLQQESGWTNFLLRGIGSIYAFTVTVMFIPF